MAGKITQDPRDFAVRILGPDAEIVGTGVAVTLDGHVVTCQHVIEDAVIDPGNPGDAMVTIEFPGKRPREAERHEARVIAALAEHNDDIALLQLTSETCPLESDEIAVIGAYEPGDDQKFKSYDYRQLGERPGARAGGDILGASEPNEGEDWRHDPIQLRSQEIDEGMSGAPVLDLRRNVVVGIVTECVFREDVGPDLQTAFAVDLAVLGDAPFNLDLHVGALPRREAYLPDPTERVATIRQAVLAAPGDFLSGAEPPLEEWVGREALLTQLDGDWRNPGTSVVGLIGFGGEGKSSLARRSLDRLRASADDRPAGTFWWPFYKSPNADAFFEAAINWLTGGRLSPEEMPRGGERAEALAALLGAGRYLLVLDGFEVMQEPEGDDYGRITSDDLRQFLLAHMDRAPPSFCLVSSRAPLADLASRDTYRERDVDRLSAAEGRDLLRNLGVVGADQELEALVTLWDGHALTLSLIGAYLADWHQGAVDKAAELPHPTSGEGRYQRVARILRRYDEHLSDEERAFLTIFSAFRLPVPDAALEPVFREGDEGPTSAADPGRLVKLRLLRYDADSGIYTTHPLIREHYRDHLEAREYGPAIHRRIADFYQETAKKPPKFPALDDLAPWIEAVHHLCRSGQHDTAFECYSDQLRQGNRHVLTNVLGAYEVEIDLVPEFFPDRDTARDPMVTESSDKSFLLNELGFDLSNTDSLNRATPLLERAIAFVLQASKKQNASAGFQNLSDLKIKLGVLAEAADHANQALNLAKQAEDKSHHRNSLAWVAFVAALRGMPADEGFDSAERLERESSPAIEHLYSRRGIAHADYLRRRGDYTRARRITDANRAICDEYHWPDDLSGCHRVLGDLDTVDVQPERARDNYQTALTLARSISRHDVLIQALSAYGRFLARHGEDATGLLNEALRLARNGGYRLYEVDVRVGLAWAALQKNDGSAARRETGQAQRMSADMGYAWGRADADEVLAAIAKKFGEQPAASRS